jgi:hypothetical protein
MSHESARGGSTGNAKKMPPLEIGCGKCAREPSSQFAGRDSGNDSTRHLVSPVQSRSPVMPFAASTHLRLSS